MCVREIEFRGKRVDNDKWVYGYFIRALDIENTPIKNCIIENMSSVPIGGGGVKQDYYEIDLETLGQYPCLKDKNGTKIFEGDLIKSKYEDVYQVYYEDNVLKIEDKWGNGLKPIQRAITHFECEIVGNIYDNPELLESSVE